VSGFFRFVLVAMLLALIATVSAVITMHFAIHGAEVKIPELRGLTVAEATRRAALLGCNLTVDSRLYSTELPVGDVLSQSPAPGSIVRRDWDVRVTSSLGPQRVSIPNVLGLSERVASFTIRRLGLELGSIAHMPDALVAPGTVIAQNPMPNAAGVERPSVSILVADPDRRQAEDAAFVMPDYSGQPLTHASEELTRAGLNVVAPTFAPTQNGTAPGTILDQSPAAGQRIDASTPIRFTVAR
jgi:beta-lactam-binding protein with PASTA domain